MQGEFEETLLYVQLTGPQAKTTCTVQTHLFLSGSYIWFEALRHRTKKSYPPFLFLAWLSIRKMMHI